MSNRLFYDRGGGGGYERQGQLELDLFGAMA
jgi:hypothetical protein